MIQGEEMRQSFVEKFFGGSLELWKNIIYFETFGKWRWI